MTFTKGRIPRQGALLALLAATLAFALVAVDGAVTWLSAQAPDGATRHIVVSLQHHHLWLIEGSDTLMQASVAVGRRETFRFEGKVYDWSTPRGKRVVLAKRPAPVWTVPDWHYFERAANEFLDLVQLVRGVQYELADGSRLEVRGRDVIRVRGARFWKVPQGREIIIDGVLYMPPVGTVQRVVPGALGSRALDLGDGYLIHGTNPHNRQSIGSAASHGCIRMDNANVERLFDLVAVGTPVLIH